MAPADRASVMPRAQWIVRGGVDATTGQYFWAPRPLREVTRTLAQRLPLHAAALTTSDYSRRGTRRGLHFTSPASVGWAVVFPPGLSPRVKRALQPLLAWRREQCQGLYREFELVPGETFPEFADRHGVEVGWFLPEKMPYYLLLVGGPERIPWEFQFSADYRRAVGRIAFPTAAAYRRYAEGVVANEQEQLARTHGISLFGALHPGDESTRLAQEDLLGPLAEHLRTQAQPEWQINHHVGQAATRERLAELLGPRGPALVFSAGHGLVFPAGHTLQRQLQGAPITDEWPGPATWQGPLEPSHYLGPDAFGATHPPAGAVWFQFACFSGGTPRWDNFATAEAPDRKRQALTPRPFLAPLAQRLLSHPRGPALAVIGHVDQAWAYSFRWGATGRQTSAFTECLLRLLDGEPVGRAMDSFATRYGELAVDVVNQLAADYGADPELLGLLWVAVNDAKAYVVLGDPAVRLALGSRGSTR